MIKRLSMLFTSIIFAGTVLWLSRAPVIAQEQLPDTLLSDHPAWSSQTNAGDEFMPLGLARSLLTDTLVISPSLDQVVERASRQSNPITVSTSLAPGPITATATAIDSALALAADPSIITFADFITQPNAATSAVFTPPLTFFPTQGSEYVALSTGETGAILSPGTFASANLGGGNIRGNTDFDVTIWRIGLNVPAGVNCLGLDFQFLSEEYPDFIGTVFNDAFIGELDQSTWTTSLSTISAPNNFIFDAAGNLITVNSVVGLAESNGTGTAFDGGANDGGATSSLTARTPITPGPHTLYLSILDQGDHILDSVVLMDNLVVFSALDCPAGVVEKPKIYLPLIFKNMVYAPDLVVDSLTASSDTVTVVVKNIGNTPVVDPFWVDASINPNPAPSRVNQHWWELASQGLVWGVTTPIAAGDTLTLTIGDAYYSDFHSRFTGSLAAGTTLWAQVDSVNLNTTYGGVLELHEITGEFYNNLLNTYLTDEIRMADEPVADKSAPPPAASSELPPR